MKIVKAVLIIGALAIVGRIYYGALECWRSGGRPIAGVASFECLKEHWQ